MRFTKPKLACAAFHVGAHKTGTSLLQKYLRDNPSMLSHLGIDYLGRGDTNGFVGWGDKLIEDPGALTERIRRGAAERSIRYFVSSHENTLGHPFGTENSPRRSGLYPAAAPRIDALERALRPFPRKILFYLRSQEGFLESYYLQRIQQGESLTFREWLADVDLDEVSWAPVVDELRDAFGADNVVVGDFAEIEQGQADYIRRFLRRIDPSLDHEVQYEARRNRSISAKGLAIALAANPHLTTASERKLMRKFLQRNFSNARYPRPELFTPTEQAEVRARYEAENLTLVSTDTA